MKYILYLITLSQFSCFAQDGKIYNTYKAKTDSTDESHGTIFSEPFQSYNYIKTQRGIEVYETYKNKLVSTNQSHGTIFSKPFPEYIIIDNKMYQTYKNKSSSTNESRQTMFTKPFESKQIFNEVKIEKNKQTIKITYEVKYKESLPKYDGEGDIIYGE